MIAEASSWEFGWEAIVALATGLLALTTVGLALATLIVARRTQALAKVTEADVLLSQASREDSVRPVFVDVSPEFDAIDVVNLGVPYEEGFRGHINRRSDLHWSKEAKLFLFSFPLRNAGPGVALFRDVRFGWEDGEYRWYGTATSKMAAKDDIARFRFSIWTVGDGALDYESFLRRGNFSVRVEYADLARNVWLTRIFFEIDPSSGHWTLADVMMPDKLGKLGAPGLN